TTWAAAIGRDAHAVARTVCGVSGARTIVGPFRAGRHPCRGASSGWQLERPPNPWVARIRTAARPGFDGLPTLVLRAVETSTFRRLTSAADAARWIPPLQPGGS